MGGFVVLIVHITGCGVKLTGKVEHKSKWKVNYNYFIAIQAALRKKINYYLEWHWYYNEIGLITLATKSRKIFTTSTYK